jgi:putative lipoprotein
MMIVNTTRRVLLLLGLVLGTGCTSAGAPPGAGDDPVVNAIEGTASYRERIAMPPGAEFEAVLQDVSIADAPAMRVARTIIADAPNPPIRFTIPYDPGKIDAGRHYSVRAVIRVEGKLWFTSDQAYPVLTRGAGHSVDILMKRVAASPAADAALLGTRWKILSLAGEPLQVANPERVPQLVLANENGRESWSATIGCNQMAGALSVSAAQIAFKSGVATLMACPPPLDTLEQNLGQSLLASTQWRIEGNRLELRDDAGTQTLLCEAAR